MSTPLPRAESLMEVLPLALGTTATGIDLFLLGEMSMQVGWHASVHPNEVAFDLTREFALAPVIAHSTSWRTEPGKLIVTYVTIVEPPGELPPMVRRVRVGRTDLARGTPTRAPAVIGVEQVVEHALRHLAWLERDDAEIREALPPGWSGALRAYPPEPFRPFESGWS